MASRKSKRQKSGLSVDSHPIGISPLGSALLYVDGIGGAQNNRLRGLGMYLAQLDDITIMNIVEYCDVESLLSLSLTSLWCYAWANHPELWRFLNVFILFYFFVCPVFELCVFTCFYAYCKYINTEFLFLLLLL